VKTFWDASAVVPLLFEEKNTATAEEIILGSEQVFAWEWMWVEVEAALVRRKGNSGDWNHWNQIRNRFIGVVYPDPFMESLLTFNRQLGLRAADAGHVYVFETLTQDLPDLHMVTFDREMAAAVKTLGLNLHPECV
jgi:predicted nucleic acid-binding protein